MNIFSELQNIVLLIRVPDMKQELNDLIFLYLNENPSNFGVTNSINPLTTDNKSIIAFVLNNAVRTFIRLQKSDRQVLQANNLRTRKIIKQTGSLKDEMDQTRENYEVSLVQLCRQILKDLQSEDQVIYSYTPGALKKLKSYKGEIKNLETIIRDAAAYASSLSLDNERRIELTEWHIQFELSGSSIQQPAAGKEKEENIYTKTIKLLDKLEQAALVVKTKQLRLTGTNVGQACPISISAPAISDSLYNHKSRINRLLSKYPEKWEIIRNEFRPLKNIIESSGNED
jgi:hypothetical protein